MTPVVPSDVVLASIEMAASGPTFTDTVAVPSPLNCPKTGTTEKAESRATTAAGLRDLENNVFIFIWH
jgi:hypothetical protein